MNNLAYNHVEDEGIKVYTRPKRKPDLRKNKIVGVTLLLLGILTAVMSAWFTGKADITVLVFLGMFAIPLFFARENHIDF